MNNNETEMKGNVYEVSFILDNRKEESWAQEKAGALKTIIATLGGSFISEEAPYLRELSYEMIRVVNNENTRFNLGYFGWIKFEMDSSSVKELDKKLKLDEEIVRYIIVKTVRENTVYTKPNPVVKPADLVDEVNIDTTNMPEETTTEATLSNEEEGAQEAK